MNHIKLVPPEEAEIKEPEFDDGDGGGGDDETPASPFKRLLCFLRFHKWHYEAMIARGPIRREEVIVGYYETYRVVCERCGKIKLVSLEA